jgi:hypothetical protein
MINVSGHRMGTAEVEAALVSHPKVSEAAVVGFPHNLKGQGIYCYVTLIGRSEQLGCPQDRASRLGAQGDRADRFANLIQLAPGLPKTRSGKIMRRILRKIAEDDFLQSRRYFDAGPSRCGRRPHPKPAEQVEFITISASTRADQRGRPAVDGSHHGLAAWLLPHHPSR